MLLILSLVKESTCCHNFGNTKKNPIPGVYGGVPYTTTTSVRWPSIPNLKDKKALEAYKKTDEVRLVEYAKSCLDALGVVNSPAHMEIMMTEKQGPVLIECGMRLHGGYCPILWGNSRTRNLKLYPLLIYTKTNVKILKEKF